MADHEVQTGSGDPPKKWLRADQRRRSLVDAGWDLAVEGGPRAVTIDAVVERLGISRPIFYRHFDDRIGLLVAMYDRYADQVVRIHERVLLREDGTLDDLIHDSVAAYLDMVQADGMVIRPLVEAAGGDPRMAQPRRSLNERHFVLWQAAIVRRFDPELREIALTNDQFRDELALAMELIQHVCVEAATVWLAGRTTRQEAETVIGVMLDQMPQRFIDRALFLTYGQSAEGQPGA